MNITEWVFLDGQRTSERFDTGRAEERFERREADLRSFVGEHLFSKPKRKRKLSAWNKYVKNKRNHIKYRDGTLNLKKMAVAFRRKKRGRK